MNSPLNVPVTTEAVNAHLNILQAVIQRMASNSASSKAWCITLVSAILVVVADKGKPDLLWIAVVPTMLFLVLDAYYLALERAFRASYNRFIDHLHSGRVTSAEVYAVVPVGNIVELFFRSLISFAIWPFYLTLLLTICLATRLVV